MGYLISSHLSLGFLGFFFQFPLWDTAPSNPLASCEAGLVLSIPFMGYYAFME